jgi:sugar phosphate isomerase/epimerase
MRSDFLIPSVTKDERSRITGFKNRFGSIELDLMGMPKGFRKDDVEELIRFSAFLRSCGMSTYSVHLRNLDLSKPGKKDASAAISQCNIIQPILSPDMVVLHPGRTDADALLSNLEFLLARISEKVAVVLENMTGSRSILSSPRSIDRFIKSASDFPDRLGICIDTAHPPISKGQDFTSFVIDHLEAAGPRLLHMHVSDRAKTKHLPIGQGIICWDMVRHYLHSSAYPGKGAIEVRSSGGTRDPVLSSAERFYGPHAKDFNYGAISQIMNGTRATREEILEESKRRFNLPPEISTLLEIPAEASKETGDSYTYYFIPSKSFGDRSEDPYYSLTGGKENLGWADYLFGHREDGGKLHILLIDKKRSIAVEETIFNVYEAASKYEWEKFGSAIRSSLDALKRYPSANHIEYTFGQPEAILESDERAW